MQAAALSLAVVVASTSAAPTAPTTDPVAPTAFPAAARGLSAAAHHPALARADDGHDDNAVGAPSRIARRANKAVTAPAAVQTIRFDDDDIDGNHEGPVGDFVQATPDVRHGSLIELRATLVPEIARSLEDL
jgi:hypothetical protein